MITEKKLFSAKDVVWFSALLVSVVSTFLITQSQVKTNSEKIQKLEITVEQNNLELINYKINELSKKQDGLIDSFDSFLDDYYKRTGP